MDHEAKVEAANKAIRQVYGDTSVSAEETASSLQSLKDHIDVMLDTLNDD